MSVMDSVYGIFSFDKVTGVPIRRAWKSRARDVDSSSLTPDNLDYRHHIVCIYIPPS